MAPQTSGLNDKPHHAAYGLIAIGLANLAYYLAVGRHLPPPQQTPQSSSNVH